MFFKLKTLSIQAILDCSTYFLASPYHHKGMKRPADTAYFPAQPAHRLRKNGYLCTVASGGNSSPVRQFYDVSNRLKK